MRRPALKGFPLKLINLSRSQVGLSLVANYVLLDYSCFDTHTGFLGAVQVSAGEVG